MKLEEGEEVLIAAYIHEACMTVTQLIPSS